MSEADVGEPIWLDRDLLEALHDRSIERHGGLPGIRDEGALLSAIARPQNKFAYGESDVFILAAAYGFGLARSHAFSDGNKRIATIATFLFLEANGFRIERDDDAVTATFLALAAGDLDEDALAGWLRKRAVPVG